MVKYVLAAVAVLLCAAPAFSQDFAQVELGFGYGNVGLPNDFETGALGIGTGGHHGFATHQTVNLTSWLGFENYFGYYGLGETGIQLGKAELLSNIFGGRVGWRGSERFVPYAVAGFGGGWLRFPNAGGSTNAMAARLGGGVDIGINESFAWKVDVSRMSFHFLDQWSSGINVSTGIVIKIVQ